MKSTCRPIVATAFAALAFTPGAWAQGCVLCYTSVAAGGPAAMHAFQLAMFVLLIPALSLFLGLFLLIFRRARTEFPARALRRNRSSRWRLFSPGARPVEGRV